MTAEIIDIVPVPLKWFHFHQNNSGGSFIVNDKIAHDVYIQATTADIARYFAERIPLAPYEDYCPCCGERWSLDSIEDKDGTSEPMKYGERYADIKPGWFGDEARFHYIDGHIEAVFQGQEPARRNA